MMKLTTYFSKGELTLWGSSAGLILISFFLFDRVNFMTLAASLIGTTSLIFNAKGNPFGQLLMVIFSLLYGVISYTFSYYGEMITYLGMTMPMAVFALISWLRNPYKGNKAEVKVNTISRKEHFSMWIATIIITIIFFYILDFFDTPLLVAKHRLCEAKSYRSGSRVHLLQISYPAQYRLQPVFSPHI